MLPKWFNSVEHNFRNTLLKLKGKEDLVFLQIGAYTGDASIWLLDNILTDPTSFLVDVDTWAGSDEKIHKTLDWNVIENTYLTRTKEYTNLHTYKATSDEFFANSEKYEYDFIYIDGDHTASAVRSDAENSWKMLKSGGILAFDDYLWKHDSNNPELSPAPAINSFIEQHYSELEVIVKNYQIWIKKL
jgi:predicted O-methyltransferase YrrM